jgi:hypothetical protein
MLLAKQAITERLHQYCVAMDRCDRELGYDVWHPDGTAHYDDAFEGSGRDFVDFGQGSHETVFDGTSHQVTNVMIDVDGDRAQSLAYVTAALRIAGTELHYVIRGRYQDTWSCRDGQWRIDARRFDTDLWHVFPRNHELMAAMLEPPEG